MEPRFEPASMPISQTQARRLQSLLLSDPSTYFFLHDFSLLRREQQIPIDSVLKALKIPIATHDAGRRVELLVQQQVTHENSFFELRE